jgi:N-acylglucosamine 2-epimerase
MIFSLAFYELGQYLNEVAMIQAGLDHAEQVMTVFLRPDHKRAFEFVSLDNSLIPIRAVNPGHALESMWFMIHIYRQEKNEGRIRQAIEAMRWHLELGWDERYGGLFLARDAKGTSWEGKEETKIWWPHTEALYALLLAYSLTRESWCLDWFQRVHNYSFQHFPVPQYGEWVQNLDRQGRKIDLTAGLPVKDPFHLSRSLVYSIGVLEKLALKAAVPALA